MNYQNKPAACTISLRDANEQSVVWETLIERATSTERIEQGVVLTFDRGLTAQVEDLVDIERRCCSFLDFAIDRSSDGIRLVVSAADAAGLKVIHDALGVSAA
ncbi:MAG: hypothetical protein M3132_05060 [Actinomycetia bacterium]|nr:hypothetical protein [Actinomycetes bacterium]